jgi:hypothetical protein
MEWILNVSERVFKWHTGVLARIWLPLSHVLSRTVLMTPRVMSLFAALMGMSTGSWPTFTRKWSFLPSLVCWIDDTEINFWCLHFHILLKGNDYPLVFMLAFYDVRNYDCVSDDEDIVLYDVTGQSVTWRERRVDRKWSPCHWSDAKPQSSALPLVKVVVNLFVGQTISFIGMSVRWRIWTAGKNHL